MVKVPQNVFSCTILCALVQKLIFQDGVGGHLGLCPLAKKFWDFLEGPGVYFFYKRSLEVKSIIKPC